MKNKKIIFAGLVVSAFMVVVLSANSANASFWNWFKAGDDNTAAVTRPSSSKSSSSRSSKSSSSKLSSSKSSRSSATTTKSYTLKINKSGKGYVSDEDKRIDCGTNCKEEYVAGSKSGDRVKLTAVPDGGYVFEKFTPAKECLSVYSGGFGFNDNKLTKQAFAYGPGENVVCVTTMNKNKTITAIFKKIPGSSSSSKSKSSSSKSSLIKVSDWETYRNNELGFEVKYPANIFQLDKNTSTLSHTLNNFHKYSAKDGSDLELANDISIVFKKENDKGCNWLETGLGLKSIGIPFKSKKIKGVKYETGAEGEGVEYYCVKNKDSQNVFLIERWFLNVSYSTDLPKQSDYINGGKQEEIFNQVLSTFKFTK